MDGTLDRLAAEVVNSCTGVNVQVPGEEGVISMSEGFRQLVDEYKAEGKAEGIAEGEARGKQEARENMIKALRANGASEELIQAALRTMEESVKAD